ncbi:MAG: metalloregulator ArsR/SmtB family transcription factor [Clostridiales bacterium]|nr:metalloregulator ArsR/SmtB family transcription factor [Clostridiales bacterium]
MQQITLPHDHGQDIEKVLAKLPTQEQCAQAADHFKLISDGSRLRILWLLCHCEECVSNIAAAMEMSDPAVSHHLKLLRRSGLIVSRREGKEVYYRLADTAQAKLVHRACEEMFQMTCPLEQNEII